MSAFGIVLHAERGPALAVDTIEWLVDRGHEVRLLEADAKTLDRPELGTAPAEMAIGLDLLVSLGGDGTMLRTVRLAATDDVAVLGVNLGQLGYLTEVEPDGVRGALKRFLAGSYEIEERMRMAVAVETADGDDLADQLSPGALNEAVIEKSEMGHTVRLEVHLDGHPFTSYLCDGLILATPTGSTAYAFSVRGPIVDPTHRAVILSPVAPHMLFDRSLVLGPDCEVRVTIAGDRPAGLSVDGRSMGQLRPGDAVVCTGHVQPARLVTFGGRDFHAVLRSKFGLAQR